MDKVIIFKNLDESCGIIYPSPYAFIEEKTTEEIEVEEEINFIKKVFGNKKKKIKKTIEKITQRQMTIEEIAKKSVPEGLSYRITTADKIPADRTFRAAWTDHFNSDTVDVDMQKARALHMEKIRTRRNEKFIELGFPVKLDDDLERQIIPEEKRQQLQALRNIPQNINLEKAKTPEKLKTIWPENL